MSGPPRSASECLARRRAVPNLQPASEADWIHLSDVSGSGGYRSHTRKAAVDVIAWCGNRCERRRH